MAPSNTDLADLRQDYTHDDLSEQDADPNPFRLFQHWLDEALAADIREPNAMTLATAGADGQPAARIVLLKGFDEQGFVFYTNYESRKGRDLEARPRAALVFWWDALERQVRIEGTVERVAGEESEAYFASRPRGSRLGAWASDQSRPVPDRETLEERLREADAQYPGDDVPRPPHWGGYRVVPSLIEFWQGRSSRLHDRLQYTREAAPEGEERATAWAIQRLAP